MAVIDNMQTERRLVVVGAAALAAGVVGGAIWWGASALLDEHLSMLAILVALGVAGTLLLGTGRRRSRKLQVVSVAIVLPVMLLTEYFVVRSLGIGHMVREGIDGTVPFLMQPKIVWDLVAAGMIADPLTILFFAVAIGFALGIVAPRKGWEDVS